MISEPAEDREGDRRRLALALVASSLVNLCIWVLAIWSAKAALVLPRLHKSEREFVVTSSSLRIEHRIVPRPAHVATPPHPVHVAHTAPAPHAARRTTPHQSAIAQQRELARIATASTPAPPRTTHARGAPSLSEQLAEQETAFEREAQELRAQNAPLSVATASPPTPSTFRRSFLDMSGRTPRERVEALLQPLPGKHWVEGGMSCYYVHYYAQFSGGGNEEGNIPWPVCYPADHDAMLPLDHPHDLPIPYPPAGYALPAGAALGPLLESIYRHTVH